MENSFAGYGPAYDEKALYQIQEAQGSIERMFNTPSESGYQISGIESTPPPIIQYQPVPFVQPKTYEEKVSFIQSQDLISKVALTGDVSAAQTLGTYLLGHEPSGPDPRLPYDLQHPAQYARRISESTGISYTDAYRQALAELKAYKSSHPEISW